MNDFKSRLNQEQIELSEKLNKLQDFIQSENFNAIHDTQKALLNVQATAMMTYNQCLLERLSRL